MSGAWHQTCPELRIARGRHARHPGCVDEEAQGLVLAVLLDIRTELRLIREALTNGEEDDEAEDS